MLAEGSAPGLHELVHSGQPDLEEAWWFGEEVLPLPRRHGRWGPPTGSGIDQAQPAAVPFVQAR